MRRSRRKLNVGRGSAAGGVVLTTLLFGFIDLMANTQMIGLAAASLSIPYVNTKSENNGDKKIAVSPIALFARLEWAKGNPHDVDFWVECYTIANGGKSYQTDVNYKQKNGFWLDLVKDDLGGPSYLNEEVVQANSQAGGRVPPNTSCRFNVHLYHSHDGKFPLDGDVFVIQDKDSDQERLVGDVPFSMKFPGQELTILTATWDERGNLIPDSVERYPEVHTKFIATATLPTDP